MVRWNCNLLPKFEQKKTLAPLGIQLRKNVAIANMFSSLAGIELSKESNKKVTPVFLSMPKRALHA